MELEKLKKERAKHCLEKKEQIEKLKQVFPSKTPIKYKQSLEAVKTLKKKRESDLETDMKSKQSAMEKYPPTPFTIFLGTSR
jgi:hypothetical protein